MKRFLLSAISLCMAVCLCACSGKINVDKLSEDILNNVKFDTELNSVEPAIFSTLFGVELPENATAKVYSGSSATADQFEIFTVEDAKDITEVKDSVIALRDSLKETYSSYNTAELDKINNAVIKTGGNYVIMVITNDYKNAAEIIEKYI